MARSNRWCFTLPNPGEWTPTWDPEQMDYLIYEWEVCPMTQTPHWQGYVRFKGRKRMDTVKNLLGHNSLHLEVCRGSEAENRTYCSKEGGAHEFGTYDAGAGKQGRRTDIEGAADAIKQGKSMKDVAQTHSSAFIKYNKGLQAFAEILLGEPPVMRDVHLTILWGDSGVGKSHRALITYPDAYVTKASKNMWDMYNGQEQVILDEFNDQVVALEDFNSWVDKWKLQLPCRYNNKWARWTVVVILSNYDPDNWWMFHRNRATAVRRMTPPIGHVYHVESQEQSVNMTWWIPTVSPAGDVTAQTPTAASSADAAPAAASANRRPLKRARATISEVEGNIIIIEDDEMTKID